MNGMELQPEELAGAAIYVKGFHSAESLREIAAKLDGQTALTVSDLAEVARMMWEHMVPRHRQPCSTCEGNPEFIVSRFLSERKARND